jgi:membrane complex biogenesis BtpA family protein
MKLPRLIGTIQLPPLAGSPKSQDQHPVESLQAAGFAAVTEARLLAQAGFDGVVLENWGDVPYYGSQVPPETITSMSIIAAAVRETVQIPVGINVLQNDARASLAIAALTGCEFIRANVFSGVVAAEQGILEGNAAFLIRERERLRASVAILADVHVHHGVTLSSLHIGHAIEEIISRSMADGVIISGRTTERLPDLGPLELASQVAKEMGVPLYLGSGVSLENLTEVRSRVDGVLVGAALRKQGVAGAELDKKQIRAFVRLSGRKK